MITLLIILALWLLPGLLTYVIVSLHSQDWRIETRDIALFTIPMVNILVLGFVVIITIDDLMGGQV